jgi:hypothetical protein
MWRYRFSQLYALILIKKLSLDTKSAHQGRAITASPRPRARRLGVLRKLSIRCALGSNMTGIRGARHTDARQPWRSTTSPIRHPTVIVMPCGGRIFSFIRSPCAHTLQKSWCHLTRRVFYTAVPIYDFSAGQIRPSRGGGDAVEEVGPNESRTIRPELRIYSRE